MMNVKRVKNIFPFLWGHKKLAITLFVILAVIIYLLYPKNSKVIETVKVHKSEIVQSVSASGSINSETTVNLSFLTGGKLSYVGVKKGDFVTQGQTIATLDQRTLKTNLDNALKDYALARNEFDQTKDDNQNHTPQDALNITMKRILENNQNNLEKAINSVELQNFVLEQSVLSSPIDGIVTRVDSPVSGTNITAASVFTIQDPVNLVFNAEIDEADIGKINIGQPIEVTFDAFPDRNVSLEVNEIDFVSHLSDSGATVYTVKAIINDTSGYRIGMNGDIEVVIERKTDILTVPLSSMIDDKHVYVKKENKYEKREIITGIQSDTDIEVKEGLTLNEEIALIPEEVEKTLSN